MHIEYLTVNYFNYKNKTNTLPGKKIELTNGSKFPRLYNKTDYYIVVTTCKLITNHYDDIVSMCFTVRQSAQRNRGTFIFLNFCILIIGSKKSSFQLLELNICQ